MAYTTIKKPSDYFNTKLYTGNGTTQSITGVGFQPDWTWVKERSSTSSHQIIDAVRGYNKRLFSNTNDAEAVDSSPYNDFKSIDSDGFTIGSGGGVNASGDTYASWNWLANGTGSANTDGSISSTVSANTTSGFSIVKYSGDGGSSSTVGHGLGAIPKMVIIKCRTSTPSWQVWGDGYTRLSLNNTDGDLGSNGMTRGASTVTLPSGINDWNGSGQDYIMYCWSEVQGYSKFGSYTGNGSTDGTFVYTGFKPAWVMSKRTDSSGNSWRIFDTKRPGFNTSSMNFVHANLSNAENTGDVMDLNSNGFKIRTNSTDQNTSGSIYIYMAFAEAPFVTSTGVPATAR